MGGKWASQVQMAGRQQEQKEPLAPTEVCRGPTGIRDSSSHRVTRTGPEQVVKTLPAPMILCFSWLGQNLVEPHESMGLIEVGEGMSR